MKVLTLSLMSKKYAKLKLSDMLKAIDKINNSQKFTIILKPEDIKSIVVTRERNNFLKKMFVNFFNGKGVMKNINFPSKEAKSFLFGDFEEYLTLYKFLSYGWEEICENFKDMTMCVNSPGEAIAYILTSQAEHAWRQRNNLVNPKAMYLAWHQLQKCKQLEQQNITDEKEIEKLQKLAKRIGVTEESFKLSEAAIFRSLCLKICLNSKDKVIREAAQESEVKRVENEKLTNRRLRAVNFTL